MCSKRLPNRLIKKSFRAYNTRRHFEFAVLLHGEVVRVLLLQLGEQQIHGRLKLLVVLPRLAGADEVQQGDEVALLRLRLVPDVPDEGGIVQALGL